MGFFAASIQSERHPRHPDLRHRLDGGAAGIVGIAAGPRASS